MQTLRTKLLRVLETSLLSFFAVILLAVPARADIMGATLGWRHYFGGGPWTAGNFGTFVVDGGVGGTLVGSFGSTHYTYYNIAADANSITIDFSVYSQGDSWVWGPSPLSLAPTIYNGLAIDMVSGPAFTSVTINSATNVAGFDTGRLSFTGSQIQMDWSNLQMTRASIVKLDVQTAAVPEPDSVVILGAVGAGVLYRLRRRRYA